MLQTETIQLNKCRWFIRKSLSLNSNIRPVEFIGTKVECSKRREKKKINLVPINQYGRFTANTAASSSGENVKIYEHEHNLHKIIINAPVT